MTTTKLKDAASLIIYRKGVDTREVLMGRRHNSARFAPGMYVFPGGTLESADCKLQPPTRFDIDGLGKRAREKIHGLANAAIRETWEETGLFLGQKGELNKTDHPGWEQCRRNGMVPAAHRLNYLGRAITPAESPTRFHARFFVTKLEHLSGTLTGEGELSDLRWVPIGKPGSLPMFDVTEFMLEELQRFLQGPRPGTPIMSYRQNKTLILYE